MTDTDTPPTGPAAAKTAEQFASEWLDRGHSVEKRSVLVAIIEQAMAQAHAAGREEGRAEAADIVEARSLLHVECGPECNIYLPLKESADRIRRLRTASAQPTATATEVSE